MKRESVLTGKAWKIGILEHSTKAWKIHVVRAQESLRGNTPEIEGSIL